MSVTQTNAWMNGRQRPKKDQNIEIGFRGVAKCKSCAGARGANSEEKSKPETIGTNHCLGFTFAFRFTYYLFVYSSVKQFFLVALSFLNNNED